MFRRGGGGGRNVRHCISANGLLSFGQHPPASSTRRMVPSTSTTKISQFSTKLQCTNPNQRIFSTALGQPNQSQKHSLPHWHSTYRMARRSFSQKHNNNNHNQNNNNNNNKTRRETQRTRRKSNSNSPIQPNHVKIDMKQAAMMNQSISSQLYQLTRETTTTTTATTTSTTPTDQAWLGLLEETQTFMSSLAQAVEERQLNPWRNHGKEFTTFVNTILHVYDEVSQRSNNDNDNNNDNALFEKVTQALDNLESWNLNIQESHYKYAIAVANREQMWKESANLFWKQMDPQGGYNPVNVSISNPQGLYAIARWAQQEGSPVAELVFDAVIQLSMVSPQDQTTYVLAAGNALGLAGEWEASVAYLNSSYMANRWGQDIVSSVMQVCLLSGRPDQAIQVYQDRWGIANGSPHSKKIADEWQWGGERDSIDPLTRDLLMQALGSQQGMSQVALDLFQQTIDEGITVSKEAITGVMEACELDRNMPGALSILTQVLSNLKPQDWIVHGINLEIRNCETNPVPRTDDNSVAMQWLPEMADLLSSFVRTCNTTSNFGFGLYYLKKIDILLTESNNDLMTGTEDLDTTQGFVASIASVFDKIEFEHDLIAATMVSLCGLRCYSEAVELFQKVSTTMRESDNMHNCSLIRDYAADEASRHGLSPVGNPWVSANRHIHRLNVAFHQIEMANIKLAQNEQALLRKGLSSAMQASTRAHQPFLSLHLLEDAEAFLRDGSHIALRSDSLTSEIILAHRWSKDLAGAIEQFQALLDSKLGVLAHWKLSCDAGLSAMIAAGKGKDAFQIFQALDDKAMSSEMYATIGNHLLREGQSKELIELYMTAVNDGYISEELSLLTMSALAQAKVDNRLRVMRSVVSDNAKSVGTDPHTWMRTRYWHVKRALGFYYARLLMRWNDPATCHLDELEMAIDDFHMRKKDGLKAKHDIVRTIVNSVKYFDQGNSLEESTRWRNVPRTRQAWIELLLEVLDQSQTTSITYDASFVDDVVAAFQLLNGTQECNAFISGVLDRGIPLQQTTLATALDAARASHSSDLVREIEILLSN